VTGFEYDDGGRAGAGFKGEAGDCVTRAIAIATEQPYRVVYDRLDGACQDAARLKFRLDSNGKRRAGARTGVPRKLYEAYLRELGWIFHPTMSIGSGCQVHLRGDELPAGHLIVRVSKHIVAVIHGVIHDTHDCSREGTRCVYGYYSKP
jgi:hypothetical protein